MRSFTAKSKGAKTAKVLKKLLGNFFNLSMGGHKAFAKFAEANFAKQKLSDLRVFDLRGETLRLLPLEP